MKLKAFAVVCMLVCLVGCRTTTVPNYSNDELHEMMLVGRYNSQTTGIGLNYRFLPCSILEKSPLVIFLHGAGQRGGDNKNQLYEGDVGHIVYYADKYAYSTVVVPQCPSNKEWIDEDMVKALDEFVAYCIKTYGVDENRVYLTGFSMGGIGTWKLLLKSPERYASAVSVCGGPLVGRPRDIPNVPEGLTNVSVWAFNNYNDEVVQNIYSKNIMSVLWKCDMTDSRYTEGNKGHSDDYVFSSRDVLTWLYSKHK